MQNASQRYSFPAIALHWLMALGLVVAIGVGWYASELPVSVQRLKLINWHKWAGVALLVLAVVRVLWRATHRPPPDLPMPAWQARTAHALHGLLYLLMLAVPLVGWSYSNAAGFAVVWFGALPLPDLVAPDKALAATLKDLHKLLAWALAALIALHVAAALKHHFMDGDALLARMRPSRRP